MGEVLDGLEDTQAVLDGERTDGEEGWKSKEAGSATGRLYSLTERAYYELVVAL